MNWFYNLIIGIGGLIAGMLAFADEIANKLKWLAFVKSLIFKIPFFLLASFMIIWASIRKDNENDSKSDQEKIEHNNELALLDSNFRAERRVSDSVNEEKMHAILDSSYSKSIKSSNEALAKYNLVLIDSLNRVVSKINIKNIEPQLAVASSGGGVVPIRLSVEHGINYLQIKFVSANATSYRINVGCYLFKKEDPLTLLDHLIAFPSEKFIIPGINSTMIFPISPLTLNERVITIVILGEFSKDREGKNVIPYRQAFSFDLRTNSSEEIVDINYSNIIKYLDRLKY